MTMLACIMKSHKTHCRSITYEFQVKNILIFLLFPFRNLNSPKSNKHNHHFRIPFGTIMVWMMVVGDCALWEWGWVGVTLIIEQLMCEHNKKGKIFCVTQDCSHSVPFGCIDCIRKYHKKGLRETLVAEDELLSLIKLYQVPTHVREQRKGPIYRLYQMLTCCKNELCDQLDRYFGSMLSKLKYPFLYHENILNVYRTIRDKNYHKLDHSELLAFYKTSKRTTNHAFLTKEIQFYQQYVRQTQHSIHELTSKLAALEDILDFNISKQTYDLHHDIATEFAELAKQLFPNQHPPPTPIKQNTNKKVESIKQSPNANNTLNNSFFLESAKPKLELFLTPKKSEDNIQLPLEKSVSILSNDAKSASKIDDINASSRKIERASSIAKPINQGSLLFSAKKEKRQEKLKEADDTHLQNTSKISCNSETGAQGQEYQCNVSQTDSIFIKISEAPPNMESSLNEHSNKCDTKSTIHQSNLSDNRDATKIKEENVAKRLADLIKEKGQKQAEKSKKDCEESLSNGGQAGNEIKEYPISTLKSKLQARQSHYLSVANKKKLTHEASFSDSLGKDVFEFSRDDKPKIISRSIKKEIPLPEAPSVKTEPTPLKLQESTHQKELEMAAIFLSGINQPSPQNKICFLEKYVAKYENNLTAVEYLSFLYLQEGKPKQCHTLCAGYLERLSGFRDEKLLATLAINCSAALNELGRYSQTIKCMEERLRSCENDRMHKIIADAFFSIGVVDKAVYHYERATKLNAELDEAYYNLAVILYQQNSFFNARMNIEKALLKSTNPNYLELRHHIEERIQMNAQSN